MRLASIHRYPLKSGQGEDVPSAEVEPWGLAGDRRWMAVDRDGRFVTARESPLLLTITPRLTDAGLLLNAPGREPLEVDRPDPRRQTPVQIWKSELTAARAHEAGAWLSEVVERDVELVHLDDPTRRATSPHFSRPDDRVGFADGYPLLVTNEASLAALNAEISAQGSPPVPMRRFRPSIVVEGDAAWSEDDWRLVRVGDATFRAVKGCARCVITTLEPDRATGDVARGMEPIRSLARIRRFGSGVWFGVNLIPDTPGARISVGDEVEVLEAAPPGGGPLGS